MVCYTVLLACAGVFLALVLLHRAAVAPMLGILVVFGASRAFENPAGQSLLPTWGRATPTRARWPGTRPHGTSPRSAARRSEACCFAGAPAAAFAVAGAFFATAVALACVIPPVARAHAPTAVSWASLLAGLAFIPPARRVGAISLDLFAVLLGGTTALLLAYARDIVRIGAVGLGVLRSAPAAVALAAAIVLAGRPLRARVGRKLCSSPSRDSAAPRSRASRAGSDAAKFVDSRSFGRGGVPSFAASTASKRWARGGESRDGGVAPRHVEPCGPDAPAATARFDCRDHPPRRAASPRAGGRRIAALRGRRGGWPPAAAPRCRSGR